MAMSSQAFNVTRNPEAGIKASATLNEEANLLFHLKRGESGEVGGRNGLLLDEGVEAFAHAFGEDQRFELEAGAKASDIVHAIVVEVGEVVSPP